MGTSAGPKDRVPTALIWAGLALMIASLYAIFIYVPTERSMGIVQRIFYFHVPVAGVTFLAFGVVFVASILFLTKKERRYDLLAYCAAEIGIIFCTLVLITGPLWARPVWNTWWSWEPRLTTSLILWLIYVAYLMIRPAIGGGEKASRVAAVFGIVGFIDVPIVFLSIRWWRGLHPVVLGPGGGGLDPSMRLTLFISLAAFLVLFVLILRERYRLARVRDELGLLRELSWSHSEGEVRS